MRHVIVNVRLFLVETGLEHYCFFVEITKRRGLGRPYAGGGERVYIWTPEGASFVQIPLPDFDALSVGWSPTGGQFMLGDKDTFCCAYTQ